MTKGSDDSAARMRRMRARKRQLGLREVTLWLTDEQVELLDRMGKAMDRDRDEVARFLIFKSMRQYREMAVEPKT